MAIGWRRGHSQQASTERELVGAMAVGQQPVVTNTMKDIRQYVQEEAAHELAVRDPHDFALGPVTVPILLPAEADMGFIDVEQATIGDGDPMGVAREIGQNLRGTGEDLFRIDDPLGCAQRAKHGGKCLRLVEVDKVSKKLQLTSIKCRRQTAALNYRP